MSTRVVRLKRNARPTGSKARRIDLATHAATPRTRASATRCRAGRFSLGDAPAIPRYSRHGSRALRPHAPQASGSWSLGFLLSSVIWGVLGDYIGWRGMLWIGVLPALSIVYIRYFVKEPPIWVENRRRQLEEKREVRAPLIKIFQRGMLSNTLLACWWMASNFTLYYSIWALFATHLQADLKLTTMGTAVPFMVANIASFLGMSFWGWTADKIGRRWAMIIPAA